MDNKTKRHLASAPVVFTANRLRDGRVVWLTEGGRWTERSAEAHIYQGEEAVASGRAIADAAVKRRDVVAAYDVEITQTDKGPIPVILRERVRADGPSVGSDWAAA